MAFDTIDAAAKRGVLAFQEYALLSGRAVSNIFRKPSYRSDVFMQADIIGVGPLPIVILTRFFLGGVLAVDARSHPCAASWRRTYCRMPPCSK
jgi:phospholipid/cholesterol/gamma-HCH transport system permease protein